MAASQSKLESHWRLMYPSKYLCAADLRGQDYTLTIKSVSVDDLQVVGTAQKKRSVLIGFEEAEKKLVANKTNLTDIASLYGALTDDWLGKTVTLYPTKKEKTGKRIKDPNTGKGCEAIRIRTAGSEPDTTNEPADEPSEEQSK